MGAWSWIHNHRWLSLLALGIIVVGTAGGTCWAVFFRTVASPVSLRDALRLYRNDLTATPSPTPSQSPSNLTAAADSPTTTKAPLLVPGVFTYKTTGGEALSLPGASRTWPASTQVVVAPTSHDCTTMDWVPVTQHTELTTVCAVAHHSIAVTDFVTHEEIGGTDTTTTIDCPATTYLVPPIPLTGAHWTTPCRQQGSTENVTLNGQVLSDAPVTIGNEAIPAVHVRLTMLFNGIEQGTSPLDFWISPSQGLLLKEQEVTNVTQSGFHYTETMTAQLSSLTPAR